MVQIAHGWELDVERGPDWLFVRPHSLSHDPLEFVAGDSPDLADEVWALIEKYFTRRLVLELDQIGHLNSYLIGQLVRLYKRISTQGGLIRLSGLSAANRSVLDQCRLTGRLPCYDNRTDAVMATRPAHATRLGWANAGAWAGKPDGANWPVKRAESARPFLKAGRLICAHGGRRAFIITPSANTASSKPDANPRALRGCPDHR